MRCLHERFWALLPWVLGMLLLPACEPGPGPIEAGDAGPGREVSGDGGEPALPESPFVTPEGLAVAGKWLVVANPNYHFDDQGIRFGTGFLTILDRERLVVVRKIPLPAPNPQTVLTHGDRVLVLCSGSTTFDGEHVRPLTDGALVAFRQDGLAAGEAPEQVVPLPRNPDHPLLGYPSSMAVVSGEVWIGSGTTAALFVVDLASGRLVRGSTDPFRLGDLETQDTLSLTPGGGNRLIVGSFNRDRIFLLDTTSKTVIGEFEVGTPGAMDGVLSLAFREDGQPNLFILLGLANRITAVTLGPHGVIASLPRFATTGSVPNALLLDENRLLLVNSGDNHVVAFDADSGDPLDFRAVCPLSSNPYGMALGNGPARRDLYVSALAANAVLVFDAWSGERVTEVR